jgi:carbon monoxide dehydrogenase subunit G
MTPPADLPEPPLDPEAAPKRVTETGLAIVHEGEIVYPAAGSEAEAELAMDDREAMIVVYFPVEVEVRLAEVDPRAMRGVAEEVLDEFARLLEARA